MATIRKRNGKWQVQVRILGGRPTTRTFHRRQDADRWALDTEAQIQRGTLGVGIEDLRRTTLVDLISRYRDAVTPRKRGRKNETIMLNALLRQPFARNSLANLTAKHFSQYRDDRLETVKPATINRELTALSHIYTTARSEWGLPMENPIKGIARAKGEFARNRRLREGELDKLLGATQKFRKPHLRQAIEFAIETGMRRGEILSSRWEHLDEGARTLTIPTTKTGRPRTIPLSSRALAILSSQRVAKTERPFPLTVNAFALSWKRLIEHSKLQDLHFHDLRHEAVSRFFEMGLTVPEVALISGHRDPRMLFRYTHLRAEDVVAKLT